MCLPINAWRPKPGPLTDTPGPYVAHPPGTGHPTRGLGRTITAVPDIKGTGPAIEVARVKAAEDNAQERDRSSFRLFGSVKRPVYPD